MIFANVVSDYKDTNFWKQFTTSTGNSSIHCKLFQTTKIQTFESNSQHKAIRQNAQARCFRLQRYKLLKAIHNSSASVLHVLQVVSDYKDTNFWKQFTTYKRGFRRLYSCFRLQRYKLLKAIHNDGDHGGSLRVVVSDYKDTNFWKQFTTPTR